MLKREQGRGMALPLSLLLSSPVVMAAMAAMSTAMAMPPEGRGASCQPYCQNQQQNHQCDLFH